MEIEFLKELPFSKHTDDLYFKDIEFSDTGIIIQKLLEKFGLTKNVIDDYNFWVQHVMPRQIEARRVETDTAIFTFSEVKFEKPMVKVGKENKILTPKMCRDTGATYSSDIRGTLTFTPKAGSKYTKIQTKEIYLFNMPIMVGSVLCHLDGKTPDQLIELGECPNDFFGYFIIKGTEKILISKDKLRTSVNFIISKPENKGGLAYYNITCVTDIGTTIVNMNINTKSSVKTLNVSMHHNLHKEGEELPIFLLFNVLGYTLEEAFERINYFLEDDEQRREIRHVLTSSVVEYENIRANFEYEDDLKLSAITYIAKEIRKNENKKFETLLKTIEDEILRDLFGNIRASDPNARSDKALHLARAISILARYLCGYRDVDNRDSWSNKRIHAPAGLMEQKFGQIFGDAISDKLEKEDLKKKGPDVNIDSIDSLFHLSIGKSIVAAFAPGGWGMAGHKKKDGTDPLKRETPLGVLSQVVRITSDTSLQVRQTTIRQVQMTQIGFVCLAETPEGKMCGIVKNPAQTCYISRNRPPKPIIDFILTLSEKISVNRTDEFRIPILINSRIFRWSNLDIFNDLIQARRRFTFGIDFTIFYNEIDNCIEIYTDSGRLMRPLFVVENDELVIDRKNMWNSSIDELLREGCIEYIDAREQEFLLLHETVEKARERYLERLSIEKELYTYKVDPFSENPELFNADQKAAYERFVEFNSGIPYSYCEISPIAIFGVTASLIPMANREQGPRVSYQASMSKQSLGGYHFNHHLRFDTSFKRMIRSTQPIFKTDNSAVCGLDRMPAGDTVITAFLALPDNQEDAIVAKEETFKNGKFELFKYITHKLVAKKGEEFKRPAATKRAGDTRFHAIQENGIPELDTYIKYGDCIIGKVRRREDGTYENASVYAGVGQEGYIDRIFITKNIDGQVSIKVKIRQRREYIVADKLACYSEDHEVFTKFGWKDIRDVCENREKIAVLIQNSSGGIEFEIPDKTHIYNYCGEMYRINSEEIQQFITPNHMVYVKPGTEKLGLYRIDQVYKNNLEFVKFSKNKEIGLREYLGLDIDDFIGKYGMWLEKKTEELMSYYSDKSWMFKLDFMRSLRLTKIKGILDELTYIEAEYLAFRAGICFEDGEFNYKKTSKVSPREISKEPFFGKVYCITVSSGVFFIRYKNKVCLSGNSRYSQKGTVGKVVPGNQLPRIYGGPNDGLVPDFFINPHSIPSRMTMGKIIEMLASKAAIYDRKRINATTFEKFDIEYYRLILEKNGCDPNGDEKLILPNGKILDCKVFVGPCYYQALRHHVLDKIQVRARGSIKPISHQPVKGRSNEGGLRVGEQERDSFISHGASGILQERLMKVSDEYTVVICKTCGTICIANFVMGEFNCRLCVSRGLQPEFGVITIPYVMKLLLQLLAGIGVSLTFKTEKAVKDGSRPEAKSLL